MTEPRPQASPSDMSLSKALDMIDWYRRCLEDVQDGKPVRGLDEAKHGYDAAMEFLHCDCEHEQMQTSGRPGAPIDCMSCGRTVSYVNV